ncbi:MAG TPA: type II toxin-antitoxin system VapC family toxin [Thermoanaerobaculia bacterium]|nr:type II toxin-antitoxin system VapC family toxin [Thermoanaerobaculia bacterium]
MPAADTNVIVRLLRRDHDAVAQVARAETFVAEGVWVSHLVVAETMWVLREAYEFTHDEVITAIELLLNHATVVLQEPDVVAEALDQYRRRPALGFSDCLILATARKAGHLPLGTFDKTLATLDGTARL